MAEKEYIEREAVLKCVVEDGQDCELDLGYWDHNVAFQKIIKEIPAADVRPVVRGKWKLFGRRGIYGVMYGCSAYHAKYDGRTNFCPNCGAGMRTEGE